MKEITLVDYEEKYSKAVKELQDNQWGKDPEEEEKEDDMFNERSFAKVALCEGKVIGIGVAEHVGDSLHMLITVISPPFQKQGLGTLYMDTFLNYAKEKNCKIVYCEAVEANGKTNAEKLLLNYGFENIYTIHGYWGSLYPKYECLECHQKPCQCNSRVFIKKL